MKCPRCKNNVSELDETCPRCGLIFDEYEETEQKVQEDDEEKSKTILLKIINIIQLIGCIIFAIVYWSNEEILIGFVFLFGGIILYAFIKGFTNIIDLLDDINYKLDK